MSDKKLSGRVAVISGASKGLGRAIALALGGAGAKLALVSRDEKLLRAVAGEVRALGTDVEIFPADVTDEAQVARVEKAVIARFGKVHILVNNAGVNIRKPMTIDADNKAWDRAAGGWNFGMVQKTVITQQSLTKRLTHL